MAKKICFYSMFNQAVRNFGDPFLASVNDVRQRYRKGVLEMHPNKIMGRTGKQATPEETAAFQAFLAAHGHLKQLAEEPGFESLMRSYRRRHQTPDIKKPTTPGFGFPRPNTSQSRNNHSRPDRPNSSQPRNNRSRADRSNSRRNNKNSDLGIFKMLADLNESYSRPRYEMFSSGISMESHLNLMKEYRQRLATFAYKLRLAKHTVKFRYVNNEWSEDLKAFSKDLSTGLVMFESPNAMCIDTKIWVKGIPCFHAYERYGNTSNGMMVFAWLVCHNYNNVFDTKFKSE